MSIVPSPMPVAPIDAPHDFAATAGVRKSRPPRGRVVAAVTTLAMATVTLGAATGAPAQGASANTTTAKTPSGSVVVFGCADPAGAARAAGGHVVAGLPLISGVAADLPKGAQLTDCTVIADSAMHVSSRQTGKDNATETTTDTSTDTTTDPTSTARRTIGLQANSPSGSGVAVAVVDTGIAEQPDLAGRVIHADVTGSSWNSDRDDYGHGTFVAGLIAGNGRSSDGDYQGAAPKARLLDVRVAADDGSTSLIQVLRGLQVVALTQKALNIRVLNLSLSSGSPIPYQLDPLSQALEALWARGVVVVAPAGNDGPGAATISSPGSDPVLLTVGALDEAGTGARSDDTVAPFSARGPAPQGIAKPDLVAPGSHLISLRAPGSAVDDANPSSRVGTRYFRGSGTSMSTALASGVAADLLSARPKLTPDQVKTILTSSAYRSAGLRDVSAAGAGGLDATAALATAAPKVSGARDDWPAGQNATWDRFSAALLDGDRPAAGYWWQQLSPAARSWTARSWTARSWTDDEWTARSWTARSWAARSWTTVDWS